MSAAYDPIDMAGIIDSRPGAPPPNWRTGHALPCLARQYIPKYSVVGRRNWPQRLSGGPTGPKKGSERGGLQAPQDI